MGLLDRVVEVGRLLPPPELVPPVAAELRLVAVARGLAVAAVRAAGAGLEDTVVAATVTGAVSAALGALGTAVDGAGVLAAAGMAVTGVVATGVAGAALASAELAAEAALAGLLTWALLAWVVPAEAFLAVARDLGVAMAGEGGAR